MKGPSRAAITFTARSSVDTPKLERFPAQSGQPPRLRSLKLIFGRQRIVPHP
jgi:hypothetical protein